VKYDLCHSFSDSSIFTVTFPIKKKPKKKGKGIYNDEIIKKNKICFLVAFFRVSLFPVETLVLQSLEWLLNIVPLQLSVPALLVNIINTYGYFKI
jgi:hypothetical protein